jgi:hypothetical protein
MVSRLERYPCLGDNDVPFLPAKEEQQQIELSATFLGSNAIITLKKGAFYAAKQPDNK